MRSFARQKNVLGVRGRQIENHHTGGDQRDSDIVENRVGRSHVEIRQRNIHGCGFCDRRQ
jgi:hypothetical protein